MITHGLPFADYLRLPGVHFSTLRSLDVSPLHYRRAVEHERADTPSLRLGRVTHAMVLTPDVPADVAVWDGGARRGKAWEAFVLDNAGRDIVKVDELATAERMRAAVMAHPVARDLLTGGEGEVTIQWTTDAGVKCRARADYVTRVGGLVELKTTRYAQRQAFMREAARRLYHAQIAFYEDGLRAVPLHAHAHHEPSPHLIAVENVEPFDVSVHRIGIATLDVGRRKVDGWLRTLAECEASGRWPGAGGDEAVEMVLPDYALADGLPDVDMGDGENEAAE